MLGAKSTVFYLFERRVIRTELKVMTSLMYDVIFKIKVFLLIYSQLLIPVFTQIVHNYCSLCE